MRVAAVMIDLGWPWWVSLIIALSVAAVCALALLRTSSGVVRGVLGLVVVQGAVLGALSPFVMSGSSSGGTGGGMHPPGRAMASDPRSSSASIHVIEHAPPSHMQMTGNLQTFANPVFDSRDAKQVGRDQGFCVHIVLAKSFECVWTTILPGGQITVEGPESDMGNTWVLGITGGTGKYENARGWLEEKVHNKAGTEFDEVFHVSG